MDDDIRAALYLPHHKNPPTPSAEKLAELRERDRRVAAEMNMALKEVKKGDPNSNPEQQKRVARAQAITMVVQRFLVHRNIAVAATECGLTTEEAQAVMRTPLALKLLRRAFRQRLAPPPTDDPAAAEQRKQWYRLLLQDLAQNIFAGDDRARVDAVKMMGQLDGYWGGEKGSGAPTGLQKLSQEELGEMIFGALKEIAARRQVEAPAAAPEKELPSPDPASRSGEVKDDDD